MPNQFTEPKKDLSSSFVLALGLSSTASSAALGAAIVWSVRDTCCPNTLSFFVKHTSLFRLSFHPCFRSKSMTIVSRSKTCLSFWPYTNISSAKIRNVPIAGARVFERAAESHVLLDFNPITERLYVNLPVIFGQPLSWPVKMRSSGAIIIQW